MLGKLLGKITGKSIGLVTGTPEFVISSTKATIKALVDEKNGFVTEFKSEFSKPNETQNTEV